ncbi:MAG: hypothetical protein HZB19_00700 [Chloroflexi bacterium]|nr:hypothetical protein [Chloroflexota bacterium]
MPITLTLITELFFFGFTLWLGAYLLARAPQKMTVLLTGLGLLAYALALAVVIIFSRFILIIMLLPALLWVGAAIHLLPEESNARPVLLRVWALAFIPIAILTLLNGWFAALIIGALLACAVMISRLAALSRFKNTIALIAVLALFITLSTGLLILPLNWFPPIWGITLLGLDLICLGLAITTWDAFDEGETIRAHLLRSFVSAFYYAGIPAALVIALNGNLLLLVCLTAFGILAQTFSDSIQALLDKLTLPPQINDQRQTLRETADALPRLSALDPAEADDMEFARLTRRALSHLGDLPKLAASPLTNLSSVNGTNPLDRAQSLKSLLIESIQKLKPQSNDSFGTTDEWRYYNSLHFPYVLGLKPYTHRADYASLDASSRAVLDWFQTSVPERTLHNWQNTAAKLVAEDLKVSRTDSPIPM